MNIEIHNESKEQKYQDFKNLCPDAKEIIHEDGSKSLVVERDGEIAFRLDYIKKGQLSERDIFVVKNWGLNPENVEQIVEAYNQFMPEPITMDSKFHYCTCSGLYYMKEIIKEIQKLNPGVEIKGEWITKSTKSYKNEGLTITCSQPLENLNMPQGYFGNALNRTVFPATNADYKNNLSGNLLNFNLSEANFAEYFKQLQELNPNIPIHVITDSETKVPRITSAMPLDKLKMPQGYYGGIGYDKDGYVGHLADRTYTFAIGENGEFVERTNQYINSSVFKGQQAQKKQAEVQKEQPVEQPIEKEETQQPKQIDTGLRTMSPDEELAKMARENRKFTILQRERAMSDAQKAKNRSAIMAGICILGAAVATYFNGQDINTVLQHELNAVYSWEALGQYLQDLGPMTTMLAASAGAFVAKYFKNSRKFKKAQNEFIDFNASLENTQTLGGNENAKSR